MSDSLTSKNNHPVPNITKVIDGKRYSSQDATCVAYVSTMSGETWLMQTQKGNFFAVSIFAGWISGFIGNEGKPYVVPLERELARAAYSAAQYQLVDFETAFDEKVEDA